MGSIVENVYWAMTTWEKGMDYFFALPYPRKEYYGMGNHAYSHGNLEDWNEPYLRDPKDREVAVPKYFGHSEDTRK